MGIEGCDDDAAELDPVDLGDGGGEEEEAFGEFWVADEDGDGGGDERDDFGEGDDEEDAGEGDESAGPLEGFIFVLAGVLDEGGVGLEGLEAHEVLLAFGMKGGAPDAHEAAEEGGAKESD